MRHLNSRMARLAFLTPVLALVGMVGSVSPVAATSGLFYSGEQGTSTAQTDGMDGYLRLSKGHGYYLHLGFPRSDEDSIRGGNQTHPGIDDGDLSRAPRPRTNRPAATFYTGNGLRIRSPSTAAGGVAPPSSLIG